MENDQFMPLLSPRWQQGNPPTVTLSALPEDEEVGHSLTPSEFKDRLIFGPSIDSSIQSSSPSMLEAFVLATTPRQPSPSHEFHQNPFLSDPEQSQDQQWLVDPNFKWKKPNLHRSKTAPAMATINEVNQQHEPQPEQLTPQCTTVGYGDRAFRSLPGRLFASIWLLVSTLAVARAFLYLAEFRADKRNRRFAKWALGQDMTVSQFLAADIDNNGFVSKSEYVIYKLKEMGKISDKDILLVCKKFDELDSGNNGKITLADLMHSR